MPLSRRVTPATHHQLVGTSRHAFSGEGAFMRASHWRRLLGRRPCQRHIAATRAWPQGRLSVAAGASPCVRRSVARLGLPRQVHAMTATTLLPFQPDATTPAQRASVSYLARYSRHTRALYAYQLRRWFGWCETNALDPLVGIQRAHIELYIRYLGASGLMASSVNTSMHAVCPRRVLAGSACHWGHRRRATQWR